MILALALSPSLDVTYEVDALRRGEISRPDAVTRVAGGKSLNVARVAHALGADVRAVAALGGHIGAWIADLLAADGVPADVVPLDRPTRACAAIVERGEATSSTDLYEPATPLSPDEWAQFQRAAEVAVQERMPWVAVSGSLPDGVEPGEAAALLVRLRDAGARIAVDCSGPGLRALGPVADLVKVNLSEARSVMPGPHPDAPSAAGALRAAWGCDVVVTDGIRGATAVFGDETIDLDAPRTTGRFPAGSGDAFLGGLLAGLDTGLAVPSALALARDAAERNARIPGQGVLAAGIGR